MARGEPLIRQWHLLKALQAHRFGISADDLAKRLDCSKRQVQRDLAVLHDVGFPVTHDQRDFGKRFWKLAPHFIESEQLVLTVTEMVSLYLGQQLLAPLAGTPFGDGLTHAIDKIKALLPDRALHYFASLDQTLTVRNPVRHDYADTAQQIGMLNQAIATRRAVRVHYRAASTGCDHDWIIHPFSLVLFGVSLYCIARIADTNQLRTLKVVRVRDVTLTDQSFDRPDDFSPDTYFAGAFGIFAPGSGTPTTVTATFTDWAATSLREQQWHESQTILHDTPDHLVARFQLTGTTEFQRWILGFGRNARIDTPQSLADTIANELTAAANHSTP